MAISFGSTINQIDLKTTKAIPSSTFFCQIQSTLYVRFRSRRRSHHLQPQRIGDNIKCITRYLGRLQ